MSDHKFTIDLSGLELTQAEQARISIAVQAAAMNEVASISTSKGKGINLDLNPLVFKIPQIGYHGGVIAVKSLA